MLTKILVLDDNPQRKKIIEAAIEPESYLIAFARDGKEGVVKFDAFKPDLLLANEELKDITGIKILRDLKKTGKIIDSQFILMTKHEEEEASFPEKISLLQKPFKTTDIITLLEEKKMANSSQDDFDRVEAEMDLVVESLKRDNEELTQEMKSEKVLDDDRGDVVDKSFEELDASSEIEDVEDFYEVDDEALGNIIDENENFSTEMLGVEPDKVRSDEEKLDLLEKELYSSASFDEEKSEQKNIEEESSSSVDEESLSEDSFEELNAIENAEGDEKVTEETETYHDETEEIEETGEGEDAEETDDTDEADEIEETELDVVETVEMEDEELEEIADDSDDEEKLSDNAFEHESSEVESSSDDINSSESNDFMDNSLGDDANDELNDAEEIEETSREEVVEEKIEEPSDPEGFNEQEQASIDDALNEALFEANVLEIHEGETEGEATDEDFSEEFNREEVEQSEELLESEELDEAEISQALEAADKLDDQQIYVEDSHEPSGEDDDLSFGEVLTEEDLAESDIPQEELDESAVEEHSTTIANEESLFAGHKIASDESLEMVVRHVSRSEVEKIFNESTDQISSIIEEKVREIAPAIIRSVILEEIEKLKKG
ncbi:MAG: response regulator [Nitrospinae bacterium]|nr:response regulator [Nitrospinota bacterium]